MDINGISAIVTGGGTGIGAACATRLAQDGMNVTICGRTESKLTEVVDRIKAGGASGQIRHQVTDVTVETDVAALVAGHVDAFGRLDGFIANAGGGGGYLAPWKFIKDPTITDEVGVNIEDRMSKEAAKYIAAHKDKPFYLNYWAFSVHSPWNARADYIEHFKSKADPKNPQHNPLYAAMVKTLDDGIGRLLQAVDDAGIADNTIIVFYSDNGGYAYPPKKTDPEGYADIPATSNLPLRSGKASLYEGGTREPFIFTWPGKAKAGATSDILFQSVDFYPTLLSFAGLTPRAGLKLDGYDQSKALIDRWHGKGSAGYAMTPRFSPTSTPDQLHALGALWAEHPDCAMQTHLSEQTDEIAWVKSLYPEARDYLDTYERAGLIGAGAVFGHAIHLEPRERARLAETRSAVVHCPTSNTFIGSGLCDVAGLIAQGTPDRKSTRLNSSHRSLSRMPSSA